MKKIWISTAAILLVLAIGGGAFWAGMSYGRSQASQASGRFPREGFGARGGQAPDVMLTRQAGQGDATQFGGGIRGTIQAIEGEVLVITANQETIRVETTDTTLIEKYMAVGVDDLEVDEQVIVLGRQNDDGSITARSIQLVRTSQIGQPSGGQ
ncbi:MAG: hypothetical protein JXA89_15840 [Anaerolineae bacterium]|nr:hypothetical protein [Anaerolineae bacterium]